MELSNNFTELHALVYTLLARIDVLEARVKELEAENTALKAENAALKVQLSMNSTNSHKPPSTDIFLKKQLFQFPKERKKVARKTTKIIL